MVTQLGTALLAVAGCSQSLPQCSSKHAGFNTGVGLPVSAENELTAELCVYRELLGCPLKCLDNIVSTRCRRICILATVSSSSWAQNPTGNQTIWSQRAQKAAQGESSKVLLGPADALLQLHAVLTGGQQGP